MEKSKSATLLKHKQYLGMAGFYKLALWEIYL